VLDKSNTRNLLALNHRDRALIELVYFQGFTNEQAALLLKMPEETLKARARIIFREWSNLEHT
jgi:DNA-directed RNA polymerase specialized sigma24 family protein